jgi:hypothetical protein
VNAAITGKILRVDITATNSTRRRLACANFASFLNMAYALTVSSASRRSFGSRPAGRTVSTKPVITS